MRIQNMIRNKLRGTAGETITETLVALLIAALALVMLAGAVSSGSNVIVRSKTRLEAYYAKNENLASHTTEEPGSISITIQDDSRSGSLRQLESQTIENIRYYENREFGNTPVIAYQK